MKWSAVLIGSLRDCEQQSTYGTLTAPARELALSGDALLQSGWRVHWPTEWLLSCVELPTPAGRSDQTDYHTCVVRPVRHAAVPVSSVEHGIL